MPLNVRVKRFVTENESVVDRIDANPFHWMTITVTNTIRQSDTFSLQGRLLSLVSRTVLEREKENEIEMKYTIFDQKKRAQLNLPLNSRKARKRPLSFGHHLFRGGLPSRTVTCSPQCLQMSPLNHLPLHCHRHHHAYRTVIGPPNH